MKVEERAKRFLEERNQVQESISLEDINPKTGIRNMVQTFLTWAANFAANKIVERSEDPDARVIAKENSAAKFQIGDTEYRVSIVHQGIDKNFVLSYSVRGFNNTENQKLFEKTGLELQPGTDKVADLGSVAVINFMTDTDLNLER